MSAVIRLKRRVDEDPLNAFVLNCKRQRTESDGGAASQQQQEAPSGASDETSTVLKFAGTFTKADNISTHLQQRLSKQDAKEAISKVHRPTITSRNRLASRQTTQNSRFRIVNCTRSLSQVEGEQAATTTIVDVERDLLTGGSSVEAEQVSSEAAKQTQQQPGGSDSREQDDSGFVYDLYVVDESQQQAPHNIPYIPDNLADISVAIFDDPLYSGHRGPGGDRSDSAGEESEDSNDENNWRNDYPDEDADDDGQSCTEEDMRRAVERLDVDDLTSDEDYYEGGGQYSGCSHCQPDSDDECDYGCNDEAVIRFGKAYARYRARVMRGIGSHDVSASDFKSDNDGSSSASDGSDRENFDLYD